MLSSCMGGGRMSSAAVGGEVTGVGGTSFSEPVPYGMVLVNRGSLKMGTEKTDTLWGKQMPSREISVDAFWMDETEVSNSKYRQFVFWVRDSIIRERLADPAYGGDESFKIEEDKSAPRAERVKSDEVTKYLRQKPPAPFQTPQFLRTQGKAPECQAL